MHFRANKHKTNNYVKSVSSVLFFTYLLGELVSNNGEIGIAIISQMIRKGKSRTFGNKLTMIIKTFEANLIRF